VQKVSKNLTARIVRLLRLKWKEKFFFACAQQGHQTLTACGAKFFNYAFLEFCTIVMHIKLDTCVPNLRGR
jgi:hypothetical protein